MAKTGKNIGLLYVIKISKWFNLVMPVMVLFYQDNGMGMHEIFVLKAIYSLAIVALELPSGWMADAWGRRKTLILGTVLGSAGFFMYSFSHGFWAFVLAEIVLGTGHSFVSGADSAMLYESLKADNKPEKYVKHEGRITSAGNFAEAVAGIVAGFLAAVSLRTPFYFQFAVAAMAVPAAWMLLEPASHRVTHVHSVKKMVVNIRDALVRQADLRTAVLLSAATGTATLTFAWLVQPFFKAINVPVEWFGILWTVLNLSTGVSSALAHHFEGRFSRGKELLFIVVMLTGSLIFSGLAIVREGLIFLLLFYVVRGPATPIFKNYINLYTPNEIRATILSVRNLVIRISFALIGPLLGWMTDHVSLKMSFVLAGVFYFIASGFIVLPWIRKGKR